ncbi:SURF1 family protein [Gemmatimonas groenlandica]|uniref:SURF1-like protein n=1 Tax=Gemmatimonas groenlandica TaxID=2732249 RepID=A0A6M4IJ81_9BACT|nr:SURF1 family protein [Gemmatimonas groenlandica]QJR34115.1 SURF1 family protein [Gemmatimonas groenlandica]
MSRRSTKTLVFGVLTVLAAAVCIRLGIWQLDRLAHRRAQNAIVLARGTMPVVSVSTLQRVDTTESHWRRVHLRGVADYAGEVVHATRSQAGSPGVHLLTPVRPVDGAWGDTAVLVLRGFVYSPDGRTFDREKARESDTLDLDALVISFPAHKPGMVQMQTATRAVRLLDRDTIAALTGHPLAPFLLLALGDTAMYDIAKAARVPPPSPSEGPHQSYAVQWFGFALVFLVGFVAFTWGPARGRADGASENDANRDMGGLGNAQNEKVARP